MKGLLCSTVPREFVCGEPFVCRVVCMHRSCELLITSCVRYTLTTCLMSVC